jgi:hypothetical protein
VAAGDDLHRAVPERHGHDVVDDLAVVEVLLAYAGHQRAVGVDVEVGEAGAVLRRQRAVVDVHLLVGQVGEDHAATGDRVVTPAVLVDERADVDVGAGRVAMAVTDDDLAPALGRPSLQPVQVVAVDLHLAELHHPRHQGVGGDGRRPGAVGQLPTRHR